MPPTTAERLWAAENSIAELIDHLGHAIGTDDYMKLDEARTVARLMRGRLTSSE